MEYQEENQIEKEYSFVFDTKIISYLLKLLVSGTLAGVVIVFFGCLLDLLFSKTLCNGSSEPMMCQFRKDYSINISLIVVMITSIICLTKLKIKRASFVGILAVILLWSFGLKLGLNDLFSSYAYLSYALMTALLFMLFGWLFRMRNFVAASILSILVLVVIKIVTFL